MWVWEFGLILSGQSNVHASRPSCCLHPVEILYVSWDRLVISSHLMPRLIYRSPAEVPAVPGRARALFCTVLFLPGHVWPFTPVCLTHPATQTPRSQTWFRHDSQESTLGSALTARPEVPSACSPDVLCPCLSQPVTLPPWGGRLTPCWSVPLAGVHRGQVLGFLGFWIS